VLVLALLLGCPGGDPERSGTADSQPLEDARARAVLSELSDDDPERAVGVVDEIVARGDARFLAPLVELLWASELSLVPRSGHNERVLALEKLSGEHFGASWFAWLEWLGGQSRPVPPGFAAFKADLLARLDPLYGALLAPGHVVEPDTGVEIHWSGAESIPALHDPAHVPASEAGYLRDHEPVVGIVRGGEARAYPVRILDWHEVANDVLGGEPVTVVSCPLCGSHVAWQAQTSDGRRRSFRASGLLRRSVSLLLEEDTGALFDPIDLEPVARDPERPPEPLEAVPAVLTAWQAWRDQYPATTVLALETGYDRPYVPGLPYGEYYSAPGLRFPVAGRDGRLGPKDLVYGLRHGSGSAWPLARIHAESVVNDRSGTEEIEPHEDAAKGEDVARGANVAKGENVVLVSRRGLIRAHYGAPSLGLEYVAGGEVRAYARADHEFRPGLGTDVLLDERDRAWRIDEEALAGPDGEHLPRIPGSLAYWFAWSASHPSTDLRVARTD